MLPSRLIGLIMTPEYLEQLADLADPHELWRHSGLDQMKFSPQQRLQLDTGVALRRYASHIRRLREMLGTGKSLLITPLSPNGTASMLVPTPPEHVKLKERR